MKTVFMLEFRRNSKGTVSDLKRGLALTLTYRGKPLARLVPIAASPKEITSDDPIYTLAANAETGPEINHAMNNQTIDAVLYGRP